MALLNWVRKFLEPQDVNTIMCDFVDARDKLLRLLDHHNTKADLLEDEMNAMRAVQHVHDDLAAEAHKLAAKLHAFLNV